VMHGLLTAYSQYHNRKYRKVGHLFQGRYRQSFARQIVSGHGAGPVAALVVAR
jgi:hypothetical protein